MHCHSGINDVGTMYSSYIFTAALVLTGVIIFGVKTVETTRSRYQVGFGLVISSTIFAVQASVMMIISNGRNTPPGATLQEGIT